MLSDSDYDIGHPCFVVMTINNDKQTIKILFVAKFSILDKEIVNDIIFSAV